MASNLLLPKEFATDPAEAMQRIAPILGLGEWHKRYSQNQVGGWYASIVVLGCWLDVFWLETGDDFAEHFEFGVTLSSLYPLPNHEAVMDGVVESMARELLKHFPDLGVQVLDRDEDSWKLKDLPPLW